MNNNLKITEDDDNCIIGFNGDIFKIARDRYLYSCKLSEFRGYFHQPLVATKIHRWNEKWSYEKEIECEERCQRLFQS